MSGSIFDPFAGGSVERTFPSTDPQRELWIAVQMGEEASCAFNESISLELDGALDPSTLQGALTDLVGRHESLRGTFSPDGATMFIAEQGDALLRLVDLSERGAEKMQAALAEHLDAEVSTPFDLESGPLYRATLLRLGAERHWLTFSAHHIVCDGFSMGVLLRELAALYEARKSGEAAALAPAPSFSAYAAAERRREGTSAWIEAERYWLEQFRDLPTPIDLPSDRPRPASKTYVSRREDIEIPAPLLAAVKSAGARAGCTLAATLLAGFKALAYRLTGQPDLVVGIPSAGQSSTGSGELVGHCVNTLALRTRLLGNMSFAGLARDVRDTMLDAQDHQLLTFGALLRSLPLSRDPSRLPLASVLFNIDQGLTGADLPFKSLRARFHSNPRRYENFELFVNGAAYGERFVLECQYNADLFDADTIRHWMASYLELLGAAAADSEVEIDDLPLLAADDLQRILAAGSGPQMETDRDDTLLSLVARAARAHPEAIAVEDEAGVLRYDELLARARRLALRLQSRGVRRGTRVGLCMARGQEMVVSVLAILEAGAAWVPLDPEFPRERLRFYADDAALALLLADEPNRDVLEPLPIPVLVVDEDAEDPDEVGDSEGHAGPDDVAYVIYTSGSTGTPKGVLVPHRSVVNFVEGVARELGFGPDDALLAVTTLSFDISVLEIFLPLARGGRMVIASSETSRDGARLAEALATRGINMLQATPATWRLLLAAGWESSPHLTALCGGEALPAGLASEIASRVDRLYNMYGPTETTVWSTMSRVHAGEPVRIGSPLPNQTARVLDERLRPVPFGVPGELFIGGAGVTLGYHERPALNAERFLADPFQRGGRLYRTGDVVRLHSNGELEYISRNDQQVKLRGFRIELGEIETRLASHPAIAAAVAAVREERDGDPRLVAWFTNRGEAPDENSLRAHLAAALPSYMIPQHFVSLERLPLTPNGKVDRKALPAPSGVVSTAAFVEPRTDDERLVAAIWQEVLGLPRISVLDDFFRLGGHSLLAAQALARLQRDHGIVVGLRKVFEAPTVEAFARLLRSDGSDAPAAQRIPTLPEGSDAPLSLMQQRVWFLEQFEPGTCVWNLPSAFRLHGELNAAAFERAFQTVIARHEPLRTTIEMTGDGAVQRIWGPAPYPLEAIDLRPLPGPAREAELSARMQAATDEPIDIVRGPPFRAALYRTGDAEWVFFFVVHHIVWDGWSFDILLRELDVLVDAFSRGEPSPLGPLPIRYRDFAAWNRANPAGEDIEGQRAYWMERLGGTLPVLELPTDRPRPATSSHRGYTLQFAFSREETERLTAYGQSHGATLYMVLLAGFKALLHRYTGQSDIIVGTPVRGRSMPETESLLGFFVNTLALRTDVDPSLGFDELLARVRATALDAFQHQDFPFETLVRDLQVPRDPSRTPIYQVLFGFQDTRNRNESIAGIPFTQINLAVHAAPTDLYLWVKETGHSLVCGLEYASDLYDEKTVQAFADSYRKLLGDALVQADASIAALDFVPDSQHAFLAAWNEPVQESGADALRLDELVARSARQNPEAIAVEADDGSFTYAGLEQRAADLARRMRALGVRRGARVGVCMDRSRDLVAVLLGILRAGAAWVPLDPEFPPERLSFYAGDSTLALLVTDGPNLDVLGRLSVPVLRVDEAVGMSMGPEGFEDPEDDATSGDVAYVIYTSGSTGTPKGVLVPHRSVVNFLEGVAREPGFGPDDRLLAITTLSFDISVLEIFLPLTRGGRIVLAGSETARDGGRLAEVLATRRISMLQATPATWSLLLAAGWQGSPHLTALCGGEALPPGLADEIASRVDRLYNMYGPTETTVWSTMSRVRAGGPVRIGRPLPNQTAWVLDERLQPLPFGIPGELFIGGAGVTLGYHERPELNAERFLPDPFRPGGTLYRTGDVVRLRADGELEYVGRNDQQVKVRGFRIELGEIEAVLARHPSVASAVASVWEVRAGDQRLVAYVVPAEGEEIVDHELRKLARSALPDYMVPQHIVELAGLPLTPNGKIDRKALPSPAEIGADRDDFVPPRTEAEELLAALWREALGQERVGVHDNFFDLGGHSLLCLQVVAQLDRRTGIKVPPRMLVTSSLEQIAAEMLAGSNTNEGRPSGEEGRAASSFAERMLGRLWRGMPGQRRP